MGGKDTSRETHTESLTRIDLESTLREPILASRVSFQRAAHLRVLMLTGWYGAVRVVACSWGPYPGRLASRRGCQSQDDAASATLAMTTRSGYERPVADGIWMCWVVSNGAGIFVLTGHIRDTASLNRDRCDRGTGPGQSRHGRLYALP